MTGRISMAIATVKHHPAIHGVAAKGHALRWELIFQVSTVRRKMCIFKVYMAENSHGWACLTLTLKEHLCGAMEHLLTFTTGRDTNQTTFTIRTVFILLVSSRVTSSNGTMSIAQTATVLLARKVSVYVLIDVHCKN